MQGNSRCVYIARPLQMSQILQSGCNLFKCTRAPLIARKEPPIHLFQSSRPNCQGRCTLSTSRWVQPVCGAKLLKFVKLTMTKVCNFISHLSFFFILSEDVIGGEEPIHLFISPPTHRGCVGEANVGCWSTTNAGSIEHMGGMGEMGMMGLRLHRVQPYKDLECQHKTLCIMHYKL